MTSGPEVRPRGRTSLPQGAPVGPSGPNLRSRIAGQERGWEFIALLACVLMFAIIAVLVWFVLRESWPAFQENGLGFFTTARIRLDDQLGLAFTGVNGHPYTQLNALAGIVGTILTTAGALLIGVPFAIGSALFIAVLAPAKVRGIVEPVVRLLAGVPSVIFGLLGLLLLAPFLEHHVLNPDTIEAYGAAGLPLTGTSLLCGILILAVMVIPIMVAIFVDALDNVPLAWREGSLALGTDSWRAAIRISIPWIRPALVAGTILAAGRAIGEAIALAMVAGSVAWIPNIKDGWVFLMEPVHPLAALIVNNSEGLPVQPLTTDLFAFGAVLLVSSLLFSLTARVALLPGRNLRRG